MQAAGARTQPVTQPRRSLSLLDSVSIIVGIIIGSGIYQSSPDIAAGASRWISATFQLPGGQGQAYEPAVRVAAILGVWLAGGLIALIGALCYAELGTQFPRAGGTYVFLSEAFGRHVGFAFAWAEFWIVRPGNVGAISFIMARYARQILAPEASQPGQLELLIAAGAIIIFSLINAAGIHTGKWTQNALTAGKLLGLAVVVVTAFSLPAATAELPLPNQPWQTLPTALVLVMFTYGGWADMSFVAAEVRDPARNISRALCLGTLVVAGAYILVTLAFLHALGTGGLAQSQAVAAEIMSRRFGPIGAKALSVVIVVSCLGAINGTLFTGARVYYALGVHHPTFHWLGTWNERIGVPLRSLIVQTLVTLGLVLGFGLYAEGFNRLVIFTTPFYWGFIGLAGLALLVLRRRGTTSSFRVPGYPFTPLLFLASSAAMVVASLDFAIRNRSHEAWWAVAVIAAGLIVGVFDARARRR